MQTFEAKKKKSNIVRQ